MATSLMFCLLIFKMAASRGDPNVVVFNARFCGKKKVKNNETPETPTENKAYVPETERKVFNIKRARYEVIRYGMTGFDKEQQMNSKIAMAIRLGAKPPKKLCINYKMLMEQKLKEKEALKNQKRSQYNLQPLKQRKNSSKKKRLKKQPNSIV